MTFAREGDRVTLGMTVEEYSQLLLIMGYALGAVGPDNPKSFYGLVEFINGMNAGNPQYAPYEIPEEYR